MGAAVGTGVNTVPVEMQSKDSDHVEDAFEVAVDRNVCYQRCWVAPDDHWDTLEVLDLEELRIDLLLMVE